MSIQAGRLRHRVTIQSRTEARDSVGQPIATWADVATVWADIRDVSGREYLTAGADRAEVSTKIVIRHRTDVDATCRVVHGSDTYDVRASLDPDGRRRMLQLMCVKGVGSRGR